MKKTIKTYELNRVVLAGCTPRLRDKEILGALGEAGILPNQLERVNIREQVAWVHSQDRPAAREKALDLLRAGVRKALMAENALFPVAPVSAGLVVVGGTVGGLNAALAAADRRIKVHLLVKEGSLEESVTASGHYTASPGWKEYLSGIIDKIQKHPLIEVLTAAGVAAVSGRPGHYMTEVATAAERKRIPHGAVILAGGTRWKSHSFATQARFGEILNNNNAAGVSTVVFLPPSGLQWNLTESAGYTGAGCRAALQNALRAKECWPDSCIYFIHRDILVYGRDEVLYKEARQKGVLFIRFDSATPLRIKEMEEGLEVEVQDSILGAPIVIKPDLIVMESGSEPDPDNLALAGLFGLQLREDGYFREAGEKYRPLDTNVPGVYLCGPARGPVSPEEEIVQGRAAAMGALTFLVKEHPEINRHVAVVTQKWCNGCGLCVSACPSGARSIDPETGMAQVDQTMCLGCGACQAACRSAATSQINLSKKQILEVIDELLN